VLPLAPPLLQTTLAHRAPDRHPKVRDIYGFGDQLLIVANHVLSTDPSDYPSEARSAAAMLARRSMLVKKTEPLQEPVRTRVRA
jgi:hypothetical protein